MGPAGHQGKEHTMEGVEVIGRAMSRETKAIVRWIGARAALGLAALGLAVGGLALAGGWLPPTGPSPARAEDRPSFDDEEENEGGAAVATDQGAEEPPLPRVIPPSRYSDSPRPPRITVRPRPASPPSASEAGNHPGDLPAGEDKVGRTPSDSSAGQAPRRLVFPFDNAESAAPARAEGESDDSTEDPEQDADPPQEGPNDEQDSDEREDSDERQDSDENVSVRVRPAPADPAELVDPTTVSGPSRSNRYASRPDNRRRPDDGTADQGDGDTPAEGATEDRKPPAVERPVATRIRSETAAGAAAATGDPDIAAATLNGVQPGRSTLGRWTTSATTGARRCRWPPAESAWSASTTWPRFSR
jgi:hypothetical protein